jgi:ketosteroid isomerase-like protein
MRFGFGAAAVLSILALGAPSTARAQIPDSAIPLQTVVSQTYRFRIEYAENYNKKDVAALAGMYDRNAIITTEDGNTYVGIDAIKAALTKMAPTFPHIVIKSDSMVAYGHTAIDVGTTTMHPAAGGELTSKYLAVLRRDGQDWKIVRLSLVPVPKKG